MKNALNTIATDLENLRSEVTEHETPREDIIEALDIAVRRIRAQVEMMEQGL